MRQTIAIAAALLIAGSHATASATDARRYDLQAQDAVTGLQALALQGNFQVFFPTELVKGKRIHEVRGDLEPGKALEIALRDTGLTYRVAADGTYVVERGSRAPTRSAVTSLNASGRLKDSWVLAQSPLSGEEEAAAAGNVAGEASATERNEAAPGLDEIVVTGTHIRGADPLSPVIRATRDEISGHGYARLDQFIANLPQNHAGGGASAGSNPINTGGVGGSYNYSFASGINLRGLGSNATLVLLNGQRLPQTAFGTSVDISRIPLSAIDRVEILTDGASATYGADAVAGVANIITTTRFEGLESGVRMDALASGKDPNYGAYLSGGHSWGRGHWLLNYDYEQDEPLYTQDRSYSAYLPDPSMLLPEIKTSSLHAAIHHEVGSAVTLSADVLASRRRFSAFYTTLTFPNHNFGTGDQYSVSAQAQIHPGGAWTAVLSGSAAQDKDDTHQVQATFTVDNDIRYRDNSLQARLSGPLFSLPAGAVLSAFGAEARQESYRNLDASGAGLDGDRSIQSVYGEILIPLIGSEAKVPGIQDLRLSVSGRYDHYDDFGSSTNPKVALQWTFNDEWRARASYGTSFRAPVLAQLDPNAVQIAYVFDFPDPGSPGGARRSIYLDDTGNPNLKPEHARSLSFGLALTPTSLPGLTVEATYFDIRFRDKIVRLSDHGFLNVVVDADQYAGFLNLDPTLDEVNAVLAVPELLLIDFNTPPGFTPDQIRGIFSMGYTNAAEDHPRGLDFSSRYRWQTRQSAFYIDADTSYFLSYDTRFTATARPSAGIDRVGLPPRLRTTLELGWSRLRWAGYWRINHTDGYSNQLDQSCDGLCAIGTFTTVDLGLSCSTGHAGDNGLRIALDVSNVLDEDPPFVSVLDGHFDGANASPLGRAFGVQLAKKW